MFRLKQALTALLGVLLFSGVSFAADAPATPAKANPDAKVQAAVQAIYPTFMKTIEELINMDSGSEDLKGLAKKKDYIVAGLKKAGIATEVLECPEPRKGAYVVLGSIKGTGKARMLMLIHYDTVWPAGEAAKRPFAIKDYDKAWPDAIAAKMPVVVNEKRAYGPGTSDEQPSVALALVLPELLKQIKFNDFDVITMLFNPDEEIGSIGSKAFIEEQSAKHDVVFSMEASGPPGDTLIISTRASSTATLKVKGLAAHSGQNPDSGRNAGVELSHQILQMLDLGDKSKGTDANWTTGSFGLKANVIPDSATASMNIRTTYATEVDRIKAMMEERIKNKKIPDTEVALEMEYGRDNLEPNDKTRALAEMVNAIYQNELGRGKMRMLPLLGGSDAGFSYKYAPTLEGLGIGGGGPHALTEFMEISSVKPRLYLFVRTLQAFSKGDVLPIGQAPR